VTWRNELPSGEALVNGVTVERFPVAHERDIFEFGRRSAHVFDCVHSLEDELRWLSSEGPASPSLIARLRQLGDDVDFVLLFSARYYQAYHGARAIAERAVLVPTAEREASLGISLFAPIFRGVRAIMYNSEEERSLIEAVAANRHVPGVVVGVGSAIPATVDPDRVKQKFDLKSRFAIYVGRIDANKGCAELFEHFLRYVERSGRDLDLVLIGTPVLPIPRHPRLRHLGYVSDTDKFDAIAGASVLVMPSYYESLSMVALEAWALGRPVLANARCDVLLGQCLRSNAGLFYEDGREFAAALDVLLDDPRLAEKLGANGRSYYARQYDWPVVVEKYLNMFSRLTADPPRHSMERLPGYLARRRRDRPPANAVVRGLPTGPALSDRSLRGAAV
jgi:glycosyltransferase involved in cell wall biosynthesis